MPIQGDDFSAMHHSFDDNQISVELLSYDGSVPLISALRGQWGRSLNQRSGAEHVQQRKQ